MTITIETDFASLNQRQVGVNEYEYEKRLTATVSDVAASAVSVTDIRAHVGCPNYGDPYGPIDLGAYCTELDIQHDPVSEFIWRIRAKYTTAHGGLPDITDANPVTWPTHWTFRTVLGKKTEAQDARDNPYETSAGEPMLSPPEYIHSTCRFTLVRNELSFSTARAITMAGTTNDKAWMGMAEDAVLLEGISGDEQWFGGWHFWKVTYVIHIDKDLWQPVEVADKGYRHLSAPNVEHAESPHGTLVWIDVAGQKTGNPGYIDRYPYEQSNFDLLNF